jgi:ABC-type nitrate/sulfonate/bicarbonate transport system substrate-binding protein
MLACVRKWSRGALLLAVVAACAAPAAPSSPAPATPAGGAAVKPAAVAPTAAAPAAASPSASGGPATAAAQPTPLARRTVLTAYPAVSLSAMSYMYAEEQGLYARYGVDAQSAGMVPQAALAALLNGEVQYLFYGSSLLLYAARGLPVRPFLQASTGPSLMLFARPEIADFPDLRGKAVSVLSAAGLSGEVTQLVLEKHGLNPRDVQLLPAGSAAAQMEQLRQGLAAATLISPPWPITARREGFRLLSNTGREVSYPFGIMATHTARATDDPAEVKAVIRATLDASRLIRAERDAAIAWIARKFAVEPDVAAESYDMVLETQNDNGEIPREGVANYFRVQDEDPGLRDVRYEDVVDTRLLQEVWRDLGIR